MEATGRAGGIWRPESGSWFAAIVLGVLTVEIAATTLLTWSFVHQALGAGSSLPVEGVVVAAITTGAMALLALTVYLLGFHVVGERRRRAHETDLEVWIERWKAILAGSAAAPQGPLSRAAEDALIGLTESIRGPEALRLRTMIVSYAIEKRLMGDVSSADPRKRLAALDGLATACLPQTLAGLLGHMLDPRPEMRMMAARAAARTIGSGGVVDDAAGTFADALIRGGYARGLVEEMIVLTDHALPVVVLRLLEHPDLPPSLIPPVVDAAGRSEDTSLFPLVVEHCSSADPEARAAVLRFISRMRDVPAGGRPITLVGLRDEVEFVRVNAVRAARKLEPRDAVHELWARLADPSWWVRKGAGESLAAMGSGGEAVLAGAALSHPDRFGRDMAAQVILDTGGPTSTPAEPVAA